MDRLEADRMFVAVMQAGSFARAAERLGTSPGQASKLVSRLEAELGVRLLNRTTRALSATEVGQAYYEGLRDLLAEFESLDAAVRNASRIPAGRIRLSVPLSFGVVTLSPLLIDFAARYPEITLDVDFTDRHVNVVEEGYDVVVRVGRGGDSSLIGRRLGTMRLIRCASPAYLDRRGRPGSPADLADHVCVVDTNARDPFLWRFRDPSSAEPIVISVQGRLRFGNAEACLRAAEAGEGIAAVPAFLAEPSSRAGRVVPVLQTWEQEELVIHVLYPHVRHLAQKVRALVDFLVDEFRIPPWERE